MAMGQVNGEKIRQKAMSGANPNPANKFSQLPKGSWLFYYFNKNY